VIGDLLAHLMEQRLFDVLRVQEGRTYSSKVFASQLWGGTAVLDGTLDIDDDQVGKGVDAVQALLRGDGAPAFDAADIDRMRWQIALASAARLSSNSDVARALFAGWKLGWPPSAVDQASAELASAGASEVEAALRSCRASAVVSAVAPLGATLP